MLQPFVSAYYFEKVRSFLLNLDPGPCPKRQKPCSQGTRLCHYTRMALRVRDSCEDYGSGTRDLIRERWAVSAALFSVVVGHPYHPVIETLSKSKFDTFLT